MNCYVIYFVYYLYCLYYLFIGKKKDHIIIKSTKPYYGYLKLNVINKSIVKTTWNYQYSQDKISIV